MNAGYTPPGPFAQALSRTTTSYKFLFLKGLLDASGITTPATEPFSAGISIREVYLRAIATAWYPIVTFRLSLGSQDRISEQVKKLQSALSLEPGQIPTVDELLEELNAGSANAILEQISQHLDRYVRFRFLSPWLQDELRNIPDSKRNKVIRAAVEEDYRRPTREQRLPYHFFQERGEERIVLQSGFVRYLRNNAVLVYDWWRWNFARYLQDRNPLCPGIINKLERPEKRDLTLHRMVWTQRISQTPSIRCIYSGQYLGESFDLDHFIPWSYLFHDRLWNVHPCLPTANRSKSDKLPSLEKYLDAFIEIQLSSVQSVAILRDSHSRRQAIEAQYEMGPDLNLMRLYEQSEFSARRILQENILRLWEGAEQQGYAKNWYYAA
ncbi:MAG: hypothetical protein CMF59_04805 [Leptospiraceae bacterium]|nr:hypothetical protein [Leptospiraceae bacterium]